MHGTFLTNPKQQQFCNQKNRQTTAKEEKQRYNQSMNIMYSIGMDINGIAIDISRIASGSWQHYSSGRKGG